MLCRSTEVYKAQVSSNKTLTNKGKERALIWANFKHSIKDIAALFHTPCCHNTQVKLVDIRAK